MKNKNANAGFSLIELIVVIAVMVILIGIGARWLSNITGYRARECASMVTNSLTSTKVKALSKAKTTGDVYWELERKNNRYYVNVYTPDTSSGGYNTAAPVVETSRVSRNGNVWVSYSENGGTPVTVDTGSPLRLCYNRSTGAICTGTTSTTSNIDKIYVKAGSKTYTIELVPKTGKITGTH